MKRLAAFAALLAGCGSFENPEVVLDFRVLALSASLPDQVIDIDIQNPAPPVELLDQVQPSDICVLLADREFERRLRWEMFVCVLTNDERCDPDAPISSIGSGIWDDPDLSPTPPQLCDTVPADGNLLGVALAAFESDMLRGLGGIYYGVSLRVGGEDADPAEDLWAAKTLRLMPRIPAEVTANTNPTMARLEVQTVDNSTDPSTLGDLVVLPFGRCRDVPAGAAYVVAPGARIRLTPVENDTTRETYVVPTTDGMARTFTESPTYQWLATHGNYSGGRTGGTRDPFGNPAILWTEWVAPGDIEEPTDVDLWVIQRDERLGLTWYETCVSVVP